MIEFAGNGFVVEGRDHLDKGLNPEKPAYEGLGICDGGKLANSVHSSSPDASGGETNTSTPTTDATSVPDMPVTINLE